MNMQQTKMFLSETISEEMCLLILVHGPISAVGLEGCSPTVNTPLNTKSIACDQLA